ncbi:glycosyltransferase [Flavisolibacter nicotianae]|uniref:glycosyltransferase n=1 Tax=Flavisolibacter nicotianae TaxID=2364882 RepID=UPI001F09C696|nr:glycosyltransferase [Flavisolibacter nicotianae]
MKTPYPVLHIIKSLGRGGAETLLPETLGKHDREKYCFHYIYFLPWKHQMVAEIEAAGGKVTCLPAKNNLEILRQVFRIVQYVRQNGIRLIHCHLPWAGIVGRIAGKLAGVPVVYTEHNTWDKYHKLTFFVNKLSFSAQTKVIAVSDDVAQSIKTHYSKKRPQVQVIKNGINTEKYSHDVPVHRDIRRELNIPPGSIVIGTACVFRHQKRLDTWLEIAKAVHDRCPYTRFIVAGDGLLRDVVHQKARDLQLLDVVHFPGLQAEIRPYLDAMDVFMMSSAFEGLPIGLLEAMSMGCMPACTDAGGIPELVEKDRNGILVPVEQPMEMVDRLVAYLQQPAKIKRLGAAARQTVVRYFSLQKMVTELENVYDNLLT